MVSYLLSFAWGICLLLSFTGWGGIINRILFPEYRVGPAQRATWGIAWSVVFGGLLNVTRTISHATVLTYLCLGLLYAIADTWKHKTSLSRDLHQLIHTCQQKQNRLFAIGVFIAFIVTFWHYAGCVASYNLSIVDDYQAYLVFPQKMLQIGSLGSDPFSDRRLTSALGGQSFLQALSFSVLDERSGYLIDPGCALLIAIGLIIEYCRRKNISKIPTLTIVLGFLSMNIIRLNTTGVLIPVCLFFCLFNLCDSEYLKAKNIPNNAAIVALLAAATCALKSTLIPTCIIFFILSYCFYILGSQRKDRAICEFCLAGILLSLFVLPWSISLYQSSGTLLYPILGKGFHGSVYGGSVKLANSEILPKVVTKLRLYVILTIIYIAAALVIRLGIIGLKKKPIVREAALSIFISSVLGTLAIAFATGSADNYRYSYPQLLVMFGLFILIIVENIEDNQINLKLKKIVSIAAVFLCVLVAFRTHKHSDFMYYQQTMNNIVMGINDVPLVTLEKREKYAKMLDAVPQGSIVLTRLDKPFLLKFKQHTIWIADFPGGASLPPGMPSFKGEEALADYLVSHSIRYLAYSYGNEANFPKKFFAPRLIPNDNKWLENQAVNAFEFQDSLQKLGKTRKRIYDDGENFVIDLLKYQS
ncbi:MAG: hypothetical protein ACRC62_31135 [Microcoleus sp.]